MERGGWRFARQRGSHWQFKQPVKRGTVTIPGPPSKVLSEKMWRSIMRQAGLWRNGI